MLSKQFSYLAKNRINFIKQFSSSEVSDLEQIFVFSKALSAKKILKEKVQPWVLDKIKDKPEYIKADGALAPVHLIFPKHNTSRNEFNGTSSFAEFRDSIGSKVSAWKKQKKVQIIFVDCSPESIKGAITGLEMAHYDYAATVSGTEGTQYVLSIVNGKKEHASQIDKAIRLATSVNFSRHLVNCPPNILYPESYANLAKSVFSKLKNTTVSIWDDKRLRKENMNLLTAVGQASVHLPRLVHIKYRPVQSKKPVAFVGKGVTFDSGGVNLKPGQYMRWMKKDMGGSASVFGLAYELITSEIKQPFDFYLGLVENSVANNSFRPSDVIIARNGLSVEIDNTDAEGRLVLADILALVSEKKGKERPSLMVDMATLTGASRVALGLEVGGMFSKEWGLAEKIQKTSLKVGDPVWHMPMIPGCATGLKSSFADTQNSSSGHGGAIRAALFLKKFVADDIDWMHFDINAWIDSPKGALTSKGGNGQLVQLFSEHFS